MTNLDLRRGEPGLQFGQDGWQTHWIMPMIWGMPYYLGVFWLLADGGTVSNVESSNWHLEKRCEKMASTHIIFQILFNSALTSKFDCQMAGVSVVTRNCCGVAKSSYCVDLQVVVSPAFYVSLQESLHGNTR